MSQTPLDTNANTNTNTNSNTSSTAPDGANGAHAADQQPGGSASRRRHHRPPSRRRETPATPAGQGEQQAVGETAPETAPAGAAPIEPTPAVQAEAPAEASVAKTAGASRRGQRRPAKARTPQLIRRGGSAPGETPAEPATSTPPEGTTTIEADTLTAEIAQQVERAAHVAVDANGVGAAETPEAPASELAEPAEQPFEANIETVRPADVAEAVAASQESQEPAAPRPRRYRFDRRPPATTAASTRRPERITGAFAQPAESQLDEPAAPAEQAAEPQASPAEPVAENLLALATPTSPTGTALPHAGAHEGLPAPDAYETGAPLDDIASVEDVSPPLESESAEETDAAAQEAEEAAGAQRRRRRRRRNGSAVRHLEAIGVTEPAEDEPTPLPRGFHGAQEAETDENPLFGGYTPPAEPAGAGAYAESGQPYQMYAPFQQRDDSWNVSNAYEQMRQPRSPFGAPEPNTPRGFGSQPQGIATPYQERSLRTGRGDRQMDVPPISANQLGGIITQAIQQQTDRLLAEMRHTQAPPAMTVMFPPLPSTERVAVFVDVANLLYSSRNLRVAIDFGHLLEFLRGNRRLVRAHAYAPTSPEPHAEQQFLSVVKGVGYRITTKNYKTFSSGAKKADLDLDLCMDIVRMVDAHAVDTIVLVSGDSDFLPLLEYCSDHGVRVEVAAFEDAASAILRQSCDLFVNLSLVDDIRA